MSAKHTTPAQHKSNLRNVYGTFAIEGMTITVNAYAIQADGFANAEAAWDAFD